MSDKPENMDVNLFQLVFSLQTAAMQQMGKIVSPITGKVERDLNIARTTIDILVMLEKKMKGNLTTEESKFVGQSLYELRMNFVDEEKKGDSPVPQTKESEGSSQKSESAPDSSKPADTSD